MTAADLALPRDLDSPGSIIDAVARLALRQGGGTGVGISSRGRRVVVICGAISLAVHVALALGFSEQSLRESGAIAQPTEAISIEFIATDVLEQASSRDISASAASPTALAPVEGTSVETADATPPPELEPTRTAELEPVEPMPRAVAEVPPSPETVDVPEVELLAAVEGELPPEIAHEKTSEQTRRHDEKRRKKPDREPDARKAPMKQQEKGGARSRGQAASKSAAGRVSASSGDISGYKARVLARLAAHRPAAGRGFRGTAVVSFGISRSGGLTYARISRSSGNAAADQAALASVRRAAPFPSPPAGAATGQLRFANPFHFR